MASSSGGRTPDPAPTPIPIPIPIPVSGEWNAACDSCRSAPGIPFCRVEWSFLCAGCASVVHGHNWVVAVTPNPNPNSNPHSHSHPYPFPCPNPNSDPNLVVHLSSDDEGGPNGPSNRRGRRRGAGRAPAHGRLESVMKYRQKRKSRTFEKTVRYANRKTNAEMMPRAEGKFARRSSGGEEAVPDLGEIAPSIMCEEGRVDVHVGEMVGENAEEEEEEEAGRDWTDEIGTETSVNAGRLEGDGDFRLQ